MKWNNNALKVDYPTCGCDLQEETSKHAYHKTTGWYAREVAKDGRDNWIKQYPYSAPGQPNKDAKFTFKWICEGKPRKIYENTCKHDPFINVKVKELGGLARLREGDITRGRDIDGKYVKVGDKNGYPKYVKKGKSGELAIWYSFMDETCHEGWVLGDPNPIAPSSKAYFSNYPENNGYRLFLKYDGWEADPTDCACQLPVTRSQNKNFGWFARRVKADGEDAWVKMSDSTKTKDQMNWDLNWKCIS